MTSEKTNLLENLLKIMKSRKKNPNFFPKNKKKIGVKKSKFANRLERALPKFRGDWSEVRGVNGRSKFVAASAGFAKRIHFQSLLKKATAIEKFQDPGLRAMDRRTSVGRLTDL